MSTRRRSLPQQLDDPLAIYDSGQNDLKLLRQPAFGIALVILLPFIGFCWRLMLMSFLFMYYYCLYVTRSFRPAEHVRLLSRQTAMFISKVTLQVVGLLLLLVWCASLTPLHIITPTLMDLLTPYAIHDALGMTKVIYDAREEAIVDIFAIHGLGSSPDSAWTYKSNVTNVRWLSELLPQTEGFSNVRVVLVNHQTRWDSNNGDMELHEYASELLQHVDSLHRANPDRPIIFIAHSFGGLLLKKALLLAHSSSKHVAAMTRGIIFLGVPHRGTYFAYVASCLSCSAFFRGSSSKLLEFMSVDGPGILDLESEFYDAYVVQHYPQQQQPYIYDVLEMRPERIGKLALSSIVRPKRGLLRHGRVITLDTDHRGLNKFRSSDDPNFQIFLRILRQAVDYAIQAGTCLPQIDGDVSRRPQNSPSLNESQPDQDLQNIKLAAPDILDFMSYGMPWATRNRLTAAVIGGLHEWLSSWLANDRNRQGHYYTSRVPKMAMYASLFGVSMGHVLTWFVYKLFEGSTSLEMRIAQILVSNLTIIPIQHAVDLAAMAIIAGARTINQVRATVRAIFLQATIVSWISCPIFISIAYFFVPSNTWAAFFTLCSFMLHTYVDASLKIKRLNALRRRLMLRTTRENNSPQSNASAEATSELEQESNEQQDEEEREENESESDSNHAPEEDGTMRLTDSTRQNTEDIGELRIRVLRTNSGFRIVNGSIKRTDGES